jgi:hypothetical protein
MMDGGRRESRKDDRVLEWWDWCPATTCSGVDVSDDGVPCTPNLGGAM